MLFRTLFFSLSVSPPIFIIRFLGGLILYTLARSKIPFFRFESFAFFALKLNFLLCILSVTFLLSLWTYNELLVTFGNVSSMLFLFFKEKHNHFLSEANQYFIAWTFFMYWIYIRLTFWQREFHFHRVFFSVNRLQWIHRDKYQIIAFGNFWCWISIQIVIFFCQDKMNILMNCL